MELTHMSLCSGIGGIDLAAEWAGFRTIAQCETDEYASKVLAKNFKGVPNLHDIRTVGNEWLAEYGIDRGAITVLSAGFPCQPYSLAGKGKGDGDERDLWGEVARCIGEIKPRWFVGENTPGLFARANQRYFKRILADLAALGYSVSWGIWELATSERLISESGCSLWLTPTATDAMRSNFSLESLAKRWIKHPNGNLAEQVGYMAVFPTPMATGWSNSGSRKKLKKLEDEKITSEDERKKMQSGGGGKLNPTWVEWLQGVPIGWTDLEV